MSVKRRTVWPCLAAGLLLLLPRPLAARQDAPVQVTAQGVLIDFQDAELRLVLAALAEAGGLNLAYGELPARRVTLRLRQPVPVENLGALLKSMAEANGLRVIDGEGFLRVEAEEPLAARQAEAKKQSPTQEVRLFVHRLRHVRAARLGATLAAIFGGAPAGSDLDALPPAPTSLSDRLRADRLPTGDEDEAKVSVEVGPVRRSLPGQLHGPVQIVPDEGSNSLIVRAQPDDWAVVKAAIESLDIRPLQVLIEVLIVEVRRTNDDQLSVTAKAQSSATDPSVKGTLDGSIIPESLVLELLRGGPLNLTGTLSVLATKGNVRIISRPVIFAQNNQEARILIGSERPFIQVSRTLPTDDGVRDQVIQYRDVGTKLTLTPTINDDGYVNLQVLQEVSTATAETQFGAPVISTREASTHLFVKNGETAVIGGLIDRQQERTRSGIPVLIDLPLIGGLFGTSRNTSSNSELFLFITPHVVASDADAARIRERVEQETEVLRKKPKVPPALFGAPDSTGTGNARP